MNYTIRYLGMNEYTKKLEEKYLLIQDTRECLLKTTKEMTKEGIKILEVYRTNKNGIHTNIKL